MKDNKLDKFFREKSEENLPEFDPKFWEQAERMLDSKLPEEEDRKRGAWWWWLPLLLIGGCGVCWLAPFGKDNDWMKTNTEALISEDKSNKQEKNTVQIDFENEINNENLEDEKGDVEVNLSEENTNSITNSTITKSVNTTTNNSNSLKNVIANIGQNDAPIIRSKELFDERSLINLEANNINKELNEVPTETPIISDSKIDKIPSLTLKIPNEDEYLPKIEFLTTSEADFLEIPLVEIEDSLMIDSMQLQDILKPKKLRFGWSAGAVVRREPFVDTIKATVTSLRAGLTLDYNLSKKWDFHFDLLGRRESRELTVQVNEGDTLSGKVYGFGVKEITNLYRLKTQYFVEGVGLFRYKLNERHALGVGIGVKYLFSVRADVIQRSKEAEFSFDNYDVKFVNRDEVIESGWWDKEFAKDLLPFVQLRYDYRTTKNTLLFFKLNGEYNIGWYDSPTADLAKAFRLETSFGFNYQF